MEHEAYWIIDNIVQSGWIKKNNFLTKILSKLTHLARAKSDSSSKLMRNFCQLPKDNIIWTVRIFFGDIRVGQSTKAEWIIALQVKEHLRRYTYVLQNSS